MQILITAGGTEEPIDGVRTISNFSTGRTGAVIADTLYKAGLKVTLLTSLRGAEAVYGVKTLRYQSFKDLDNLVKEQLKTGEYQGVIHLAAVSDYSVDYLESNGKKIEPDKNIKLDSSKALKIILKPNFKIISRIKSYSPNPILLIGFKLTKNADRETIKRKVNTVFTAGDVDYVVHNDLTSINKNSHISTFYKNGEAVGSYKTKNEMAKALLDIFKEN